MSVLETLVNLRNRAEEETASLPALISQCREITANIIHGTHPQRKAGPGEKFWQFREYDPSDRPQDIDWRQSAKTDSVFVKQKEWQTTQKTYIWSAGGPTMNFKSSKAKTSKQVAAEIIGLSLALLLQEGEEHVGHFGNTKTGRGDTQISNIGQYLLDQADIGSSLPEENDFTLPKKASVILVGDLIDPVERIENSISSLTSKATQGLVVQILDPAELNLPYKGRVMFQSVFNTDHHLINSVHDVREAYKNKVLAHLQSIQSLCEQNGWYYVLHVTDQPIKTTLQSIWTILSEGTVS